LSSWSSDKKLKKCTGPDRGYLMNPPPEKIATPQKIGPPQQVSGQKRHMSFLLETIAHYFDEAHRQFVAPVPQIKTGRGRECHANK
jgi:hypothetical protein